MTDSLDNILDAYDQVSVHDIERLLDFSREAWLHGFPVVRKENGRSNKQLLAQACQLLLVTTGCLSKDRRMDEAAVMEVIKRAIDEQHRVALDAADFLQQVRAPERYTQEAVEQRKQESSDD